MKTTEIIPLSEPITATLVLPGSKSYTNRALLLAALTEKQVVIKNPLFSDDTQAMISCLKTLGIEIRVSENQIEIIGSIKDIQEKDYDLDAEYSGTTIRFILALATIIPGVKTIHGKEGLNKRPIKDLVDALLQLGAEIEYLEKDGFPPLRVTSSQLTPGAIFMNGDISSQYISALLMITPVVGDISIAIKGDQISKPYIAMTIDTMEHFGVTIINKDYLAYIIEKQQYNTSEYLVEGDFSSAGYFFAIAALTKSNLILKNLNTKSKQADKKLLEVFEKMGGKITYGDNEITIQGGGVIPMEIDVTDFPDQAQTLAVLAAFAEGTTILKGVQSLRVKETERVVALQKELEKMNIKTSSTADTLTIQGGNPTAAVIDTYNDHRMAMSFAVAGTKLSGIKINDPDVVNKTFPDFWNKLNEIGVQTKKEEKTNIVLIGMRGSGKTTIGQMLADKLGKKFIDLDKELKQKSGRELAEIINTKGWDYFREQEALVARENAQRENTVIATGGGVILRKDNIDALKTHGIFIFLNANPKILAERIGDDNKRPPLHKGFASKDELEMVLQERESLYKNNADFIIDTDTINEEQTVNAIITKMKGLV
jgi:3-phosphoshikimate 1-carboxyvinyltransferase